MAVAAAVAATAQGYPSEWRRYTSDAYFHDIESATDRQSALNLARTNLARQVQVKVQENSRIDKQAVNGRTGVSYSSTARFSTDVDMSLAETKSHYDAAEGRHYVLVYIDKAAASAYYEKELRMIVANSSSAIDMAGDYIANGFKSKAKGELQRALQALEGAGKAFFWLNVFGMDEGRLQGYLGQVNGNEQAAKRMLAELEYGTTYCVLCDADLFGQRYAKLANEVKGELSAQGCNFVDDAAAADFVIRIKASARKYNEAYGAYFTYVDAALSIDKGATGQRIYEDETSVKGSHTLGFTEAARDGYKRITKEIVKLLKENIKQ